MPKPPKGGNVATIVDATKALASVCDGAVSRDQQGFNGSDSKFARSILSQAYLTQKQLAALHRMLAKYSGQLAKMGFIYSELVVPLPGLVAGATQARFDPETYRQVKPIAVPAKANEIETNITSISEKPKLEPWPFSDDEMLTYFPKPWTPRPKQVEAIRRINAAFRDGKRIVALEMPTGGGKSLVCMTFANAAKTIRGTHFLTCQKVLQRQYERDFPSPAVELLMGRANYQCSHPEAGGSDAAHGVCTKQKKGILEECIDDAKMSDSLNASQRSVLQRAVALELPACAHRCPYWEQLQKCHDHPITLFNFSSFLFQTRIGRFRERSLMLIDEGHSIETQLMGFVSLELTEWALSIIGIKITRTISSKAEFADWLREVDLLRKVDQALEEAQKGSEDVPEDLSQAEADALKELQMKLQNFLAYLDKTEWILETQEYKDRRGEETRKIVARPLYARDFADDLLFRHAERTLVMSATILDVRVWSENLGLRTSNVAHIQTECEFPAENRPIYLSYAGNCGRKTLDETKPKLVQAVRNILARHDGQRGMIHTQSFELSKLLREQIDSPRFLFQDQFDGDKEEMLREHARRTDSVIVAPGMKEGVDLKDALGRFQIILKVPYPSLGDKVVKERADRDPAWYAWQTALGFVQSLGRIVRCFDQETEILTKKGWKNWISLETGDVAYGIDPKAFEPGRRPVRWGRVPLLENKVLAVNRGGLPEETIHIKTNTVDIVVTSDHTMVGQMRKVKRHKTTMKRNDRSYTYSIPYTQKTCGLVKFSASELPSRVKIPCGGWIKGRTRTKLDNDWFWLIGFIIGDGYLSHDKNQVIITQSLGPRKIYYARKISETLGRLGLRFRYYQKQAEGLCLGYTRNGPIAQWVLSGSDSARIRDVFDRGGRRRYSDEKQYRRAKHKGSHQYKTVDGWKKPEKIIPRWVLERASPTQMLRLLEGMREADGSDFRPSQRSPQHTNGFYWTSDRNLADRLQEMLVLCGFRSKITIHRITNNKEQLCVSIVNPATTDVTKSVCVKPGPKVPVWCPSTELGTVVARRKGQTFISGNSKDDWGYTYVLDSGLEGFLARNPQMIPSWVREAFKRYHPKEIRHD